MRVAYVSTWGQQCGIATYTEELTTALVREGLVAPVALAPGESGVGIREVPGIPWRSTWARNCAHLTSQLMPHLAGIDVVHFQHENGLFLDSIGFLAAVQDISKKCKVVVTLHTVKHYGGWDSSGFYDDLLKIAAAVIVHTPEALASLAQAKGRAAKLVRIPHGTKQVIPAEGVDPQEWRARGVKLLGLPEPLASMVAGRDVSLGLVQGFQGPGKNTIASLRGFATAIARRLAPRAAFVICGEAYDQSWWSILQGNIAMTGYASRMFYQPTFIAPEQMCYVMAAADWGILNTTSWVLSSSGAAHLYAAHGVPLACANRPIYYEAMQGGAIPFDINPNAEVPSESLIDAIGALASHADVRAQVATDMKAWAAATDWSIIARKHVDLYRSLGGTEC